MGDEIEDDGDGTMGADNDNDDDDGVTGNGAMGYDDDDNDDGATGDEVDDGEDRSHRPGYGPCFSPYDFGALWAFSHTLTIKATLDNTLVDIMPSLVLL